MTDRRRTFETPEQRDDERRALAEMAEAWGAQWAQMRPRHYYDGFLYRGRSVCCFVEVKHRPRALERYDTLAFSLDKGLQLLSLTERTRLPVLVVARTSQGLMYAPILSGDFTKPGIITRHDARDEWETEPCVEIPWSSFNLVRARRKEAA